MTTRGRFCRAILTLGSVLFVAALAACGGGADEQPATLPPAPAPSAAPSETPTPTPSSSSTATPGVFTEAEQAEVEDFVRDWWLTVNKVAREATPDDLISYYDDTCRECKAFYDSASAFARAGHKADGDPYEVIGLDFEVNSMDVALVNSSVQPQAVKAIAQDGSVAREFEGGPPIAFVFNVTATSDGWVIKELLNFGSRAS